MTRATEQRLPPLVLAALAIVFGDIGTSPLYAFREAFSPDHGLPLTPEHVYSVLSMMFWAITVVVTGKYVIVMLRFDHRGEGGVLALLSTVTPVVRHRPALSAAVTLLGIFAAALFYGDAMITPAISVLAAVEGLQVASPGLSEWVMPLSLAILATLFALQRHGTARVGALFGPVMIAWFVTIAALGAASVLRTPEIVQAVDPRYALWFVLERPGWAFVALAAVFLCVTGVEVLYSELGRFGRRPIRLAWFLMVFPCLLLNYFGQGALVLRDPLAVQSPFFLLAPEALAMPLVVLAILAAAIASQAILSGAFAVTQQASRLNFLPRLRVLYTSETSHSQIYIPTVNWLLFVAAALLVIFFQTSGALAWAYGLAVSGNLLISSLLLAIALVLLPGGGRGRWLLLPAVVLFGALESVFVVANFAKLGTGAWLPLLVAGVLFTMLTTWRRGMEIMRAKKRAVPRAARHDSDPDLTAVPRVPGSAVFFSSSRTGYPGSFLHNLKHNKIAHEQTVFVTVEFDDVPRVPDDQRIEFERGEDGIARLIAHFGFREDPDIGQVLKLARKRGMTLDPEETSFFISKPVIVSVSRRGAFGWRRSLFGWMLQNSPTVASYFRLPPNRVIELGAQVAI
jgi:KUP system potassium uptake protein